MIDLTRLWVELAKELDGRWLYFAAMDLDDFLEADDDADNTDIQQRTLSNVGRTVAL